MWRNTTFSGIMHKDLAMRLASQGAYSTPTPPPIGSAATAPTRKGYKSSYQFNAKKLGLIGLAALVAGIGSAQEGLMYSSKYTNPETGITHFYNSSGDLIGYEFMGKKGMEMHTTSVSTSNIPKDFTPGYSLETEIGISESSISRLNKSEQGLIASIGEQSLGHLDEVAKVVTSESTLTYVHEKLLKAYANILTALGNAYNQTGKSQRTIDTLLPRVKGIEQIMFGVNPSGVLAMYGALAAGYNETARNTNDESAKKKLYETCAKVCWEEPVAMFERTLIESTTEKDEAYLVSITTSMSQLDINRKTRIDIYEKLAYLRPDKISYRNAYERLGK